MPARTIAIACVSIVLATIDTQAQAVKCSAFLHIGDGSWRSFESATVMGSHGPVRLEAGEIVKRTGKRDKADLATILDGLCG